MKLKGGGLDKFKEIVEEFVSENFYPDGICSRCSDNVPDIMPIEAIGDKEKYEKALKKLFNDFLAWWG